MASGKIIKTSPTVLLIQGHINESTNYRLFHESYGSGPLLLQMHSLLTINSVGLREILLLVGESPAVIYQGCPPVFLDQINLIPRLLGSNFSLSHIQSLLLDFQCRAVNCKLFQCPIRREIQTNGQWPKFDSLICEECHSPLSPIQQHKGLLYCFTPEFRELLTEFRAKDQASKQLAGLRHDFRHRLVGLEKMLRTGSGPTDKDLYTQLTNLHHMLNELKLTGKATDHSAKTTTNAHDLASTTLDQLLDDLYPELKLRAKELGKILSWPKGQCQEPPLMIPSPGHWKRLLLNLLQNSLTHCKHATEISVLLVQPGSIYCEVLIRDDGEELPIKFQHVIRTNTTEPLQQEARSLGLAICNQLCLELGGNFSYDRRMDQNHFSVLLPIGQFDTRPQPRRIIAPDAEQTISAPYLLACGETELQETLQNHLRVKKVPFRAIDPQLWLMIDLTGLKSIYTDHWALAGKALEEGIEVLFANQTGMQESHNHEIQRLLTAWGF